MSYIPPLADSPLQHTVGLSGEEVALLPLAGCSIQEGVPSVSAVPSAPSAAPGASRAEPCQCRGVAFEPNISRVRRTDHDLDNLDHLRLEPAVL